MNFNYTVIIPFRNFDEMLVKACASIPIREDIQVIIVDNGVEPVGESCLTRLNNPYIIYLTSSPTKGAGCARNVGIDHATGAYLVFLDADDYFAPTAFNSFDNFLNKNFDIICFNATSVMISTGETSKRHLEIDNLIKNYLKTNNDDFLRYHFGNPVSKMVKREMVLKYNIRYQEVPAANDTMFQVWAGYHAKKVTAVDEVVYVITEGEPGTSITRCKTVRNQFSRFRVAVTHYKFMEEIGRPDLRYRLLSYIGHAIKDFGPIEALRWILYAFKNKVNPFHYFN